MAKPTNDKLAVKPKAGALSTSSWEEEMAAQAKEIQETVKPASGGSISFKGGLSVDGTRMEDDKASIIVLGFCYENNLYEGDYDPDDVKSPVCFAFGKTEEELRPHPDSEKPQAEQCQGCEHNQWGSAAKGKGKACQNRRRLVAISADYSDPEALKEAPLKRAKIPVTSGKNWDNYVTKLARDMMAPLGVVTEVSVETGGKHMVDVRFKALDYIDPALREAVMEKRAEATDLLNAPYPKNEEKQEAPSKPNGKYAGKKK